MEKSELLKEILTRMLHKFLICLGDLARYQIEYDPNGCTKLAYKYYQQSLILLHSNGMPLNQLGTLYCSENYGCDAAYYYLYCLSCTEPFMSARENLRLLFLKNRKRYDEIKSNKFIDKTRLADYDLNELRTREIKKFLVSFLRIIDIILSSSSLFSSISNETVTNHQLQELCQLCLQDFNSCMFYLNSSHNEKLSYLSDELVFKLLMTIVMSLEQLKNKRFLLDGTQSSKAPTSFYFTTVAFALVFFSHIVNHTIIRLQESLLNLKQNKSMLTLKSEDDYQDDESTETTKHDDSDRQETMSRISKSSSSSSRDKSPKTLNKKNVRLLYGYRRRKHNSDSDTNESTFEDEDIGEEKSIKQRNSKLKINRKKNIAKFLDRDNLSETELNDLSDDSAAKTRRKKLHRNRSDPSLSSGSESDSSTSSNTTDSTPVKPKPKEQKPVEKSIQIEEDSTIGAIKLDENESLSNQSISFKEFTTQLYSRLSLLQENVVPVTVQESPQVLNNQEEFIDNEIYKFVLNGKKQVSIPPGFENNSKEAEEIEELGKKIATFQIETDTEMSIFNSNSSSENETDKMQTKDKSKCSAADFISREKLNSKSDKNAKNDEKSNKASRM